jgi:hypothetical protein
MQYPGAEPREIVAMDDRWAELIDERGKVPVEIRMGEVAEIRTEILVVEANSYHPDPLVDISPGSVVASTAGPRVAGKDEDFMTESGQALGVLMRDELSSAHEVRRIDIGTDQDSVSSWSRGRHCPRYWSWYSF